MIDYDEELLLNYNENIDKWCQSNKIPLIILGDTMFIRFGDYLRYQKGKDYEELQKTLTTL